EHARSARSPSIHTLVSMLPPNTFPGHCIDQCQRGEPDTPPLMARSLRCENLSSERRAQAEIDLAQTQSAECLQLRRRDTQSLGQSTARFIGEMLAAPRDPARGGRAMHAVRFADRVDAHPVGEGHLENGAVSDR